MATNGKPLTQPEAGSHGADSCYVVREILSRVGDKWSVVTCVLLGEGSLRFGELLRRGHGVSQRMLTQTLRQLERDGLVWRKATPTVPVTVEYGLTPPGEDLLVVLRPLFEWATKNVTMVQDSWVQYDDRLARAASDTFGQG
ncbi:MAG: HxlR family transcriptional regulator [Cyanobacteria bacterium RYN_339]|nr:HxlR family transcriptional regulator [Cyanobacteria bacterium RYN_339]